MKVKSEINWSDSQMSEMHMQEVDEQLSRYVVLLLTMLSTEIVRQQPCMWSLLHLGREHYILMQLNGREISYNALSGESYILYKKKKECVYVYILIFYLINLFIYMYA